MRTSYDNLLSILDTIFPKRNLFETSEEELVSEDRESCDSFYHFVLHLAATASVFPNVVWKRCKNHKRLLYVCLSPVEAEIK